MLQAGGPGIRVKSGIGWWPRYKELNLGCPRAYPELVEGFGHRLA